MAPRNALANISFTVDSDSEDEVGAFPTPDSNTENKAPTRKPRGKAAQKEKPAPVARAAAKGRPATRRTSAGSVAGVKKQAAVGVAKQTGARGRKPLTEKENVNTSDTEEVDEFGDADDIAAIKEPAKPAKRGRPAKAKKAQEEEEQEVAETTAPAKRTRKIADKPAAAIKAASKAKKTTAAAKGKAAKKAAEPEPEEEDESAALDAFTIPETQPEPEYMDVDIEESIEIDEVPETVPPPPRPIVRQAQQQQGRQGRQASAGLRRAGSVSDTERDPALRRKVGDLTKKLEAMTAKYDTLKEAATSVKESNFDQLKRRTDQFARDQDALIQTLKAQLLAFKPLTSELTSLKSTLSTLQKENTRLTIDNKSLTTTIATLTTENKTLSTETKTLSTKLAAARSASEAGNHKTVPGSAVKARTTGVVLPGTAEAAKEALVAKSKIDLYSDLTNLVVVGIKKGEEGEEVFDCLQTGRNGTLHFQLSISNASDQAFSDAEFVYTPLLDEKRDAELLDLLPDYLTEEICFPRNHVAKFYMKVLDSMAKRVEIE